MTVRYLVFAACAAALVLVGCGGSGEQDAVTTTTTEGTIATTTTVGEDEGAAMELTSAAFGHETAIPLKYTCDGDDVSPPLAIRSIPDDAASMVLVMDDPDAPVGTWDHWVAYDIAVTDTIVEDVGALGTAGTNSWGRPGYGGPCPPSGTHRYFFTVLALDGELGLSEGADKATVLEAVEGRVLAEAVLMGTYSR